MLGQSYNYQVRTAKYVLKRRLDLLVIHLPSWLGMPPSEWKSKHYFMLKLFSELVSLSFLNEACIIAR